MRLGLEKQRATYQLRCVGTGAIVFAETPAELVHILVQAVKSDPQVAFDLIVTPQDQSPTAVAPAQRVAKK